MGWGRTPGSDQRSPNHRFKGFRCSSKRCSRQRAPARGLPDWNPLQGNTAPHPEQTSAARPSSAILQADPGQASVSSRSRSPPQLKDVFNHEPWENSHAHTSKGQVTNPQAIVREQAGASPSAVGVQVFGWVGRSVCSRRWKTRASARQEAMVDPMCCWMWITGRCLNRLDP